jgi:hypothetical protein
LAAIFPDEITFAALGTPSLSPRINGVKGVAIEAIITFLLVLSILFATRNENENRAFAGLAIGGTLVALILFAGPLTGAGANPARYLGPAVFTGNLSQALIYIAGPMVGAGLASLAFGVVCDLYQSESDPLSRSGVSTDEDAPTTAEADDLYDGPAAFVSPEMLTLHEAHELLRAGRGHEAARKIVPLLSRIGEQSPDVLDHLRTLAIVIEDELGPVELFDRYRARIWSQAPRFAHTRSGILRERLP